jgi:hypothetical protein
MSNAAHGSDPQRDPQSVAAAAASYVASWRQRQPEMALLEPFCPPAQRPLLNAWGALTHQLTVALFDPADAMVARTKLVWWGEDLAGEPRHPVARALQQAAGAAEVPADDWRQLVRAAIGLADAQREAGGPRLPGSEAHAYGARLASIEVRLFGAPSDPAAIQAGLGLETLLRAAPPADDAVAVAGELLATTAQPGPLNLFRGGRLAFDRWQLGRLAAGSAPSVLPRLPAWRALLLAWRAARRSRRIAP